MKPAPGLRERKKLRTRAAIQREAIRLFLEQGYDRTTVAEIAAAAEISESTFFNYFDSKADVVFRDDYDPEMAGALLHRPSDEPVLVAVRRMLTEFLIPLMERDRELILLRAKISLEVPELRGLQFDEIMKTEAMVRALIAARTGADPTDYRLRVFAGLFVGALYAAVQDWVESEGRKDFVELILTALDVVEAGDRLDLLRAKS